MMAMSKRKITQKYYFTVEGETEKWYIEWLEKTINSLEQSAIKVSFNCKVEKNPYKYTKMLTNTNIKKSMVVYHLADYESDEEIHVKQFKNIIDNMKKSENLKKNIDYFLGYTNLTFDLWIILHKMSCNTFQSHRKNYLGYINKAFNENFENMDQFKHQKAFERILKKITIDDVKYAIKQGKKIMEYNKSQGFKLIEYKGYTYYKENPSLEIYKIFEKILKDCNI